MGEDDGVVSALRGRVAAKLSALCAGAPRVTSATELAPPMSSDASRDIGLAIRLDGIDVRFSPSAEELGVLQELTLEIAPGSFTALIGPNGCGKSTLLRVIAGLLQPASGSVVVGDRCPSPGDTRVGLAFQQPRLMPWRSILDNVSMSLEIAGVPAAERRGRAGIALERVGLASAAALRPGQLSGGMAQRAALARALVLDPPVLLLDEPFSALDALTREAFNVELERLWLDRRCTIMLVTHSVSEAVALADRVVVLSPRPGRVVRSVEVGLGRPRTPELLGGPNAAGRAFEVREALAAASPLELRPWAEEVTV